jgi:phosphoacetylglucosamine mutase
LKIISGDRLITLYSLFFDRIIKSLSNSLQKEFKKQIKIGIVSTAYSNGNFMKFIKENLGLQLAITKTGVKYLHPVAKKYDIGVYFESNGHGTVVYSQELIKEKLTKMDSLCNTSNDAQMLELLQVYLSMFNIVYIFIILDMWGFNIRFNYNRV